MRLEVQNSLQVCPVMESARDSERFLKWYGFVEEFSYEYKDL